MAVTRESVSVWLRKYVRAWETYDEKLIGDLFAEGATYKFAPFEEPVRGREAIVASWVDKPDPPGTFEASYSPIAIDGEVAVTNGRSRYFTDASRRELEREYDNIFVLRFDQAGRCSSFTEWYMRSPESQQPS